MAAIAREPARLFVHAAVLVLPLRTAAVALVWCAIVGAHPEPVSRADGRGAPGDSLHVFEIHRLADGVYAATVIERPEAYAFSNSLIVVGDEAVLVVDTQQSPRAARELIRRIRALTPLPVRWVVNTHEHGDHVYGNVAYREAFPGVRIVAHPATSFAVAEGGPQRVEAERSSLPESITARESWLREGRLPDGRPITPAIRAQLEYSVRLRSGYLQELRGLELVPPEGWVDRLRQVDLGGRSVELIPVGPAHTPGDLLVSVRGAGVVAVGDLLEEAAPWIEGAPSLVGWGRALETVASMEASILVPGHGRVQRENALLESTRALFADLERVVRTEGEGDLAAHRALFRSFGSTDEDFAGWWEQGLTAVRRELGVDGEGH